MTDTERGFSTRICAIAADEWERFGNQTFDLHGATTHKGHKENEDGWFQRVGEYWHDGETGHPEWNGLTPQPWSAAFISWVMKTGGAGDRFNYSAQHSVYISRAISDRAHEHDAAGFWGWRLNERKPAPGDLVCWSRQAGVDYDHQHGGNYLGHSDIIVAVGPDAVEVIGGNVGNSVTRRPLPLTADGFLAPFSEGGETLFALMQNRIA